MAEKKIKTISEILSEGGVQYDTPVNEILEEVNQNIVPSVEEKIKDSSTEEATGLITGAIDRVWVQ